MGIELRMMGGERGRELRPDLTDARETGQLTPGPGKAAGKGEARGRRFSPKKSFFLLPGRLSRFPLYAGRYSHLLELGTPRWV